MRIALAVPPVEDFYFSPRRASFLGLHTLIRILGRYGADYRIFNGVRVKGRPIPLPEELSHLVPHIGKEFFFKNYYRFGITVEHLPDQIAAFRPDHVFIHSFAFCYAREAVDLTEACRKRLPKSLIVLGGAGPAVYPEYYLKRSSCDYVAGAEAERILPVYLKNPVAAPGLHFRNKTPIGLKESSPGPGFEPVMVSMGNRGNIDYYSTMVTRGCPHHCSFCSVKQQFPGFRKAGRDAVSSLFQSLDRNNWSHVNFEDDNLTHDFIYLRELLELLKHHSGNRYSFSMENGTSFHNLDGEKIEILKGYHLRQLNLSLISLHKETLKDMRRDYDEGDFRAIVNICHSADIPVIAYLISGLP